MDTKQKNMGPSFNDFLKDEGIYEECTETAIKRILAWQIEQEMHNSNLSKSAMARKMDTSLSSLDTLLDPLDEAVTLHTLRKAAHVLGRTLRLELA